MRATLTSLALAARITSLALAAGLAGGAAASPVPAGAADARADWRVLEGRSQVGFSVEIEGRAFAGRFETVTGSGQFDPARPAAAGLEIRIDAGSIDLGNALFSAYATSAEWFDTATHPEVVFSLARLVERAPGRFDAIGDLEIKGRRGVVRGPVTLTIAGGEARAEGRLLVDRTAYGLGVGISDLVVEIGDEVVVEFDLRAAIGSE